MHASNTIWLSIRRELDHNIQLAVFLVTASLAGLHHRSGIQTQSLALIPGSQKPWWNVVPKSLLGCAQWSPPTPGLHTANKVISPTPPSSLSVSFFFCPLLFSFLPGGCAYDQLQYSPLFFFFSFVYRRYPHRWG